jgi:hypothetical protein
VRQRVWFSKVGNPDVWERAEYLDYTELRSWLRHPLLTWRWWRLSSRASQGNP